MPLHAQDGRPAGGLDGQREPAGVPSHHAQVSSHVLDALVMVGGHLGGAAQGHGEVAVDVDLRLHASGLAAGGGVLGQVHGQVAVQAATLGDHDELQAAADAQHRQPDPSGGAVQRGLEGIPCWIGGHIGGQRVLAEPGRVEIGAAGEHHRVEDRKSTRLNSSHVAISYAVFCLKKKKTLSIEKRSEAPTSLWTVKCEVVCIKKATDTQVIMWDKAFVISTANRSRIVNSAAVGL